MIRSLSAISVFLFTVLICAVSARAAGDCEPFLERNPAAAARVNDDQFPVARYIHHLETLTSLDPDARLIHVRNALSSTSLSLGAKVAALLAFLDSFEPGEHAWLRVVDDLGGVTFRERRSLRTRLFGKTGWSIAGSGARVTFEIGKLNSDRDVLDVAWDFGRALREARMAYTFWPWRRGHRYHSLPVRRLRREETEDPATSSSWGWSWTPNTPQRFTNRVIAELSRVESDLYALRATFQSAYAGFDADLPHSPCSRFWGGYVRLKDIAGPVLVTGSFTGLDLYLYGDLDDLTQMGAFLGTAYLLANYGPFGKQCLNEPQAQAAVSGGTQALIASHQQTSMPSRLQSYWYFSNVVRAGLVSMGLIAGIQNPKVYAYVQSFLAYLEQRRNTPETTPQGADIRVLDENNQERVLATVRDQMEYYTQEIARLERLLRERPGDTDSQSLLTLRRQMLNNLIQRHGDLRSATQTPR